MNFGHGKLGKVMESHGNLKSSKSSNPDSLAVLKCCDDVHGPKMKGNYFFLAYTLGVFDMEVKETLKIVRPKF